MADPKQEDIRVSRVSLDQVVAFLEASTRRLADTPCVETQQLALEGEQVLLELAADMARADRRVALWGPAGRPSLPAAPKSNKAPEIPAEVRT